MSEAPYKKDSIDEKVEHIVEYGVLIPPGLKADFLIIYQAKRDEIRAKIEDLMRFKIPGVFDHEGDAIGTYLRIWMDELQRQDSFVNYQQLMMLQELEPVDEETFKKSTQEPVFYRKFKRGMHMAPPDRVANRNCIRERWDIFRKRGFVIGDEVRENISQADYRIVSITPEARLVLMPVAGDGPCRTSSPHLCSPVVKQ